MAYDSTKPANDGFLADFPPEMREQLRAIINDQIVNALTLRGLSPGNANGNIPVSNGALNVNLNAEKLNGNAASSFATSGHVHSVATTSAHGFMSNTDKAKVDGMAAGAEVNQMAFSNVLVGSTTIQADCKTDTLEFVSGTNISIMPDTTNDRLTIGISGAIPLANGGTGATTAAGALTNLGITATAAELNALDGITATVAELNYCDGVTSAIQTQLNAKAATGQTFYLGTTQVAINRTSGALTLAGVSIGGNAATATKLAAARSINGVAFDGTADITIGAGEPIGVVFPWSSTTLPNGFLECNGQAISRTGFSELYAKIGTTFGAGDGSTTFNVPDLRGQFVRGWDNGKGVDSGRAFGTSQNDELKSHTHTTGGRYMTLDDSTYIGTFGGGGGYPYRNDVNPTGGVETRPKNVALIYIIKAKNVAGSDPAVNNANASTLGGFAASAFATTGHNHDGIYLKTVPSYLSSPTLTTLYNVDNGGSNITLSQPYTNFKGLLVVVAADSNDVITTEIIWTWELDLRRSIAAKTSTTWKLISGSNYWYCTSASTTSTFNYAGDNCIIKAIYGIN